MEKFMKPDHPQPIVVPPEAGKALGFLGMTHKLTGQHTGGSYYHSIQPHCVVQITMIFLHTDTT
jgi:hypothetical protein